jgi:hypothetical protein
MDMMEWANLYVIWKSMAGRYEIIGQDFSKSYILINKDLKPSSVIV